MCFEYLDATPGLTHDCTYHGIFMTENQNECGESYLHILNLDGFDKEFNVYRNGEVLFDGHQIRLNHKDGLLLPLHMQFKNVFVNYSTAEIIEINDNDMHFRLNHKADIISITTDKEVVEGTNYCIEVNGDVKIIRPASIADLSQPLVIRLV